MMENRSFDHKLGFMKSKDRPINGLTGTESNYPDPLHPTGTPVPMKPDATTYPISIRNRCTTTRTSCARSTAAATPVSWRTT